MDLVRYESGLEILIDSLPEDLFDTQNTVRLKKRRNAPF